MYKLCYVTSFAEPDYEPDYEDAENTYISIITLSEYFFPYLSRLQADYEGMKMFCWACVSGKSIQYIYEMCSCLTFISSLWKTNLRNVLINYKQEEISYWS